MPEGRYEIHGPAAESAAIAAWADDYIRFENLPEWQQRLRDEIRRRSRQLAPSDEHVLHATFFGAKHPNADVENLALYNIDSFRIAGCNGIRFEHGSEPPPAPNGSEYRIAYRYALEPRPAGFTDWQEGRNLATFGWTDLGDFVGEKKLAKVWLTLKRAQQRHEVEAFKPPRAPETPFAIKVGIRPPRKHQPVLGGLVKGIFDGVICAFQAHTDTTGLHDIATRLASALPAEAEEIERYLPDQGWAVLGDVSRLASGHGKGVKWAPSDHLCVAGELLSAEPIDDRWAIRGRVFEVFRAREGGIGG